MVLDALSSRIGFSFRSFVFGFYGEKVHNGKTLVFVKPTTYMNRSGEAVSYILERYGEDNTSKVIVVHDDMDIALGSVRLRWDGGDGGHKGVRSVSEALGTSDFYRIKVGIGRPPSGVSPSDYVLSEFSPDEESGLKEGLGKALRLLELAFDHGPMRAWELFNMEEVGYGDRGKGS